MKALVTGGGGFLGKAIVERLVSRDYEVRSFSRSDYPQLRDIGVTTIQGDIADFQAVSAALKGMDMVFHVAAKPGIWGRYEEYYRTNVTGTGNVITGCLKHNVRKLVYTSSPSVIYNGKDMENVDESMPYPEKFQAFYPKTKAIAEQMVLNANSDMLATVALRPHLIWGPGDNHLVPRLISRGKSGRLARVGKKPHPVDCIYIDNAADAHLLAADRLSPGSAISGKKYFISQGEPLDIADLMNRIIATAGIPPIRRTIPSGAAYMAGCLLESIHKAFGIQREPLMTRFLAQQLSTSHYFNIDAARKDLMYTPSLSIEEGLLNLKQSFMKNP